MGTDRTDCTHRPSRWNLKRSFLLRRCVRVAHKPWWVKCPSPSSHLSAPGMTPRGHRPPAVPETRIGAHRDLPTAAHYGNVAAGGQEPLAPRIKVDIQSEQVRCPLDSEERRNESGPRRQLVHHEEVGMGLFEQYPWLLVPIIVITVEAWSALKLFVKEMIRQRRSKRDAAK